MKELKYFILCVIGAAIFCVSIYGLYWVAKTGSYTFFYEDMVVETVKQTVISECVK